MTETVGFEDLFISIFVIVSHFDIRISYLTQKASLYYWANLHKFDENWSDSDRMNKIKLL